MIYIYMAIDKTMKDKLTDSEKEKNDACREKRKEEGTTKTFSLRAIVWMWRPRTAKRVLAMVIADISIGFSVPSLVLFLRSKRDSRLPWRF